MKKRLLLICTMVVICVAFVSAQNLVTNGNMETWDGSDTIPTGYKRSGTSAGVQMTQAVGRSGGYATRFQCVDSLGTGSNRFWSPMFILPKAGTYKVSFWLKGTATIGNARVVPSNSSTGNGKTLSLEGTAVSVGDWTYYEAEFPYYASTKYYVCFVFNKARPFSPNVDILLDDISVELVSSELVVNGDMEDWGEIGPGVPDSIPTGYKLSTVRGANVFSQAIGHGETGNAVRIQNRETIEANRLATPFLSLEAGKSYELSFWLKGTGVLSSVRISTSQQSTSGSNTVITVAGDGIGAAFNASDWTKYTYIITPETTKSYAIMFRISPINSSTPSDAYLDDISVSEFLSNDATLKKIAIPDPVNSGASYDYALPGFAPETTNYTVPLWFGADTVPNLKIETNLGSATYIINNGGSNAFDPGAKTKTVTITVKASDQTTTKDYNVTFDRTNYVVGFFKVTSSINSANTTTLAQFSDIKGLFGPGSTNATFHNDYWGCSSIRPQSGAADAYMVTQKLVNGAGTISFWTGALSATFPSGTTALDSMYLKLSVTTDGTWTDLKEWRIDTVALHGQWTKMEYDIKSSDPNTQVKLEYRLGTGVTKYLPIDIDDIFITPWVGTGMDDKKIEVPVALNIYPQGQSIVVAEEGRYMIYTVSGQLIASGNNTGQVITIPVKSGLYIAKSGNQAKKLVVK